MKLIRFYIILLTTVCSTLAWGQADVLFSQQQFSKIDFNPAATGFSNYANAYLFARQQWIGFEGAPSTQMFSAQGYIDDLRSGVGLFVQNDKIGRNRMFDFMLAYAYHLEVGYDKYISLGLGVGFLHRKINGNISVAEPETDPDIIHMMTVDEARLKPALDLGITFCTPKFSVGISATHVTRYIAYNSNDWFKIPMHLYAFADYNLDITKQLKVSPYARIGGAFYGLEFGMDTIKLSQKISMQYEIGGLVYYNNLFWLGATFRSGDAIVAMFGLNLGENLRFGYSYDIKLGNAFQNVRTFGSHEIMLNYRMRITDPENAELKPRFFD